MKTTTASKYINIRLDQKLTRPCQAAVKNHASTPPQARTEISNKKKKQEHTNKHIHIHIHHAHTFGSKLNTALSRSCFQARRSSAVATVMCALNVGQPPHIIRTGTKIILVNVESESLNFHLTSKISAYVAVSV